MAPFSPSYDRLNASVCQDAGKYVNPDGQQGTSQIELQAIHSNSFREEDPGAYLIQTAEGNLLWDCITLLDEETIATVNKLGGIRAIAVSHPHYYSNMADWAAAFGAPLWIHQFEANWVQQPGATFWSGDTKPLFGGVTLVCSGGHFDGYQVAHWDRGILFAGDQPQVYMDRRWVSFLYSYQNMIPFNSKQISSIFSSLAHGSSKGAVERSAVRYLKAIANPD